jgi:hypothetical protein
MCFQFQLSGPDRYGHVSVRIALFPMSRNTAYAFLAGLPVSDSVFR